MSEEHDVKALMAELERLQAEAGAATGDEAAANAARQTEIKTRLTALGHPIG